MRTIGKNRGLARLADADGHFRMVALDQRPPLFEAIARAATDPAELRRYADIQTQRKALEHQIGAAPV